LYKHTGEYNTAIGYKAIGNTAVGTYEGDRNVGIGPFTLFTQTTGSDNIGLGYSAGYNITTGQKNLFAGYKSGYAITEGNNNIFLGYQAGDNLIDGSDNIIIGYDIDASATGVSDELNIGNTIFGDLSDKKIRIGDTTKPTEVLEVAGNVECTGDFINSGETGVTGTYNFYNDGTSDNVTQIVITGGIITSVTTAP
jgi:hypothetical protein